MHKMTFRGTSSAVLIVRLLSAACDMLMSAFSSGNALDDCMLVDEYEPLQLFTQPCNLPFLPSSIVTS